MNDCACIYSSIYDYFNDEPDFAVDRHPKARKLHRCVECGDPIAVGDVYLSSAGKWDGQVKTIRTCLFCACLRETFYCEGWLYGQLWEDIEESLFPRFDGACLAKLDGVDNQVAYKRRLQRRWWAWVEQRRIDG